MFRRNTLFLLPIFWMLVIFFFSSRSDLPTNDTYIVEFAIKKSAHVFVYFMLTLSWFVALLSSNFQKPVLYTLSYAFFDEIHQLFISNRTGLLRDVFIDLIGIIIAVLLYQKIILWSKNILVLREKTPKK